MRKVGEEGPSCLYTYETRAAGEYITAHEQLSPLQWCTVHGIDLRFATCPRHRTNMKPHLRVVFRIRAATEDFFC